MPTKSLPALGDSNWGTPLNNYLQQTTDNTKGGAFNSFTNFVDRPTTLTVDDKGKTYLNNRTGNFHIWTGTAWDIKHTGGFVNVQDIGKAGYGDGANDTVAVQAAIDYCGQNGQARLFLPSGYYSFEVDIKNNTLTIFGARGNTQIVAINADGYAFLCSSNGQQNLEDLFIYGRTTFNPNLVGNSNGVKCIPRDATGNAGYFPVNMKGVTMRGCGIALYKEATLYGRFDNCDFGGDIGIFCKGSTNSTFNNNYSGFDYFTHCQFRGGSKAAIYYNNSNGHLDEAQTKFENCWFEGISGIVCLAIGTGTNLASLKFDHCWFEANSQNKGQSVTIDGNTYTVNCFIFKNSKGVIEHGTIPNGISLTDHSYLKLNYVQGTNEGAIAVDAIEYDSSSYVDCGIMNDVPAGGYGGSINFMMDFTMRGNPGGAGYINGTHFWKSKNNRSSVTRKYKNIVNFGSCSSFTPPDNGPYSTTSCTATIITGDGLYNNKCLQVTAPNSAARYGPSSNVGNTKPYVAFSMAIKSDQASATNPVDIRIGEGTWGHIILKDNNWHTYSGIIPYHSGFF